MDTRDEQKRIPSSETVGAPAVAAPAEGKPDDAKCPGFCKACYEEGYEAAESRYRPTPPPAATAGELLCKVTGNTCGSDTWPKGLVCPCEPCQSWLESQPAQAKPTRTVTHQMARNAFRKMHDALHNSLIHPAIVRFARRRYPSLSIPARLDDADIVLSDYICQQRDLATPPPADPNGPDCPAHGIHSQRHFRKEGCPPVADLEGKLRELRDTMVAWTNCTPRFATNVVSEAAALGRTEGLEEAAKFAEDAHKTINYVGPTSIIGAGIARAIRALKEKQC